MDRKMLYTRLETARMLSISPDMLDELRRDGVLQGYHLARPMSEQATLPVMATMGMLSSRASAIVVTRFVAPGPLVAMQTPTFPVDRAYPWAANPPPCSWRGRMTRIRSRKRVRA